jgi:hypothetical protein
MISVNYDRKCKLRQLFILENKDTHGVKEGHNNHGSGNKQMSLKMVCAENTETRRAR